MVSSVTQKTWGSIEFEYESVNLVNTEVFFRCLSNDNEMKFIKKGEVEKKKKTTTTSNLEGEERKRKFKIGRGGGGERTHGGVTGTTLHSIPEALAAPLLIIVPTEPPASSPDRNTFHPLSAGPALDFFDFLSDWELSSGLDSSSSDS